MPKAINMREAISSLKRTRVRLEKVYNRLSNIYKMNPQAAIDMEARYKILLGKQLFFESQIQEYMGKGSLSGFSGIGNSELGFVTPLIIAGAAISSILGATWIIRKYDDDVVLYEAEVECIENQLNTGAPYEQAVAICRGSESPVSTGGLFGEIFDVIESVFGPQLGGVMKLGLIGGGVYFGIKLGKPLLEKINKVGSK